ncbi:MULTISPECIES: helix-turn-helix domain-containing protein [Lachnospiraceae]|uniref:helix-turn-helix transcriptional regulator n=1 Tax=Lachnospiraceae TaxID=186803 RepID=UPI00210A1AD7|nr:helix-turn-helix domain-containing protein [Blautia producta]
MEHKIRLGIAVKAARQKLGLTQMELAERVGVSLRTITDMETYQANPQFDTLYQVIHVLHLPVTEIFYPDKPTGQLMELLVDELSDYTEKDLRIALSVLHGLREGLYPDKK